MLQITSAPLTPADTKELKSEICKAFGYKASTVRCKITNSAKTRINLTIDALKTEDIAARRAGQRAICDFLVAQGYDWAANQSEVNRFSEQSDMFWSVFNGSSELSLAKLTVERV